MKLFQKIIKFEHYLIFLIVPLFLLLLLTLFKNNTNYWLEFWWLFPIALIIAIIANTVGISGAALYVPFFVLVFPLIVSPLQPGESVQLALIVESFGLTSSAIAFIRFGLVDKKLGIITTIGAIPFVIIGAILSFFIPEFLFHFLIAIALLTSVILLLHEERNKSKIETIEQEKIGTHEKGYTDNVTLTDKEGKQHKYGRSGYFERFTAYGFGGIFQGMAGFGIGEMGIVSMLLTKIPIRVAIGTSHIIVAITAITASIIHIIISQSNDITTPLNMVFVMIPAVIIGGQIAPYIAGRIKTQALEHFIAGLFILLAFALFYIGIRML